MVIDNILNRNGVPISAGPISKASLPLSSSSSSSHSITISSSRPLPSMSGPLGYYDISSGPSSFHRKMKRFEVVEQKPKEYDQTRLCRYRNKKCTNLRALKRNGELHNLCEQHRAKANRNQRRLETKKRTKKRQTNSGADSPSNSSTASSPVHEPKTEPAIERPVILLPPIQPTRREAIASNSQVNHHSHPPQPPQPHHLSHHHQHPRPVIAYAPHYVAARVEGGALVHPDTHPRGSTLALSHRPNVVPHSPSLHHLPPPPPHREVYIYAPVVSAPVSYHHNSTYSSTAYRQIR